MKRNSKKGFTLAELLIVIAIIAVLVAIMVPVFGAQVNKARAAAELANVRAKFSELVATKLMGDGTNITDDPAGSVEIEFSALVSAKQYTTGTTQTHISVTQEKADAKVEADTSTITAVMSGDYYINVGYGDYFGSFKVDGNVVIKFADGSTTAKLKA